MIEHPLDWHIPVWKQLYRLAENNKLPHALLLSGPNGTGKSQFSHAFAQLLLCETPEWINHSERYKACNQCQSCRWWQANTHPNYYLVKPASELSTPKIVIEQIRDLTDKLHKTAKPNTRNAPHHYSSIVVIQSAEYLNTSASNALLKTLEEPPSGILFLLTVDQPRNLVMTILSRCQRIRLPTPTLRTGIDWLYHYTNSANQPINRKQLETALQLADYLPLKALELITNTETIDCYTQLFNSLLQLKYSAANPNQIAQIWSNYPIERVFHYLYQIIHILIQFKLGVLNQNHGVIPTFKGINTLVEDMHLAHLFNWLDIVQKAKHETKMYNLNTLLVLENLTCQLALSD